AAALKTANLTVLRRRALSTIGSSSDGPPLPPAGEVAQLPEFTLFALPPARLTRETVSLQSKTEQTSINQFFSMVNF
ncbi:MAG TPA: hypothetical protein VL460_03395, partial [Caulobacteraceae bacterium]|nr:hypothetical protein [Caulobacteraceae bacterium]